MALKAKNKWLKALRIAAWTAGSIVLLLVTAFALLNTQAVQDKITAIATRQLSEELHTRVAIESASVKFFSQDVQLRGVSVDDRQQRTMLQAESLVADIAILPLLQGKVEIGSAELTGVKVQLYKQPDSAANYQFLVDALQSKRKPGGKKTPLQIGKVTVKRVDVTYNESHFELGTLTFKDNGSGKCPAIEAEQLRFTWQSTNNKGITTHHTAGADRLRLDDGDTVPQLEIQRLHYASDNHRPRKNTGKPHRGFFDKDHLNLYADLLLSVDHASPDSLHATLKRCTARDTVTGIDVRDLRCVVAANRRKLTFTSIKVKQINTRVSIASATMHLPDKEKGTTFSFATSTIIVNAFLKDISRPFAPVLKKFSIPVNVSVSMSGTDTTLAFHNAVVTIPKQPFKVKASGTVGGFRHGERHQLHVHFDVGSMATTSATVMNIINQFDVKKFMLKQLLALGTIGYHGSFDVYWKREQFRGRLTTNAGNINFDFNVDGLGKYLSGNAQTDELQLGKVLDMPAIGPAAASAQFKIDISKERTAAMRRVKGGKLPIGTVSAHVDKVSYKFVSLGNIDVDIESDGAIARGNLVAPHKFLDLGCTFTFTNTDELQKLKVKPSLKRHKKDKDKKK